MKIKTLLAVTAVLAAMSGAALAEVGAKVVARDVLGTGMSASGSQKCEMKGDAYVYVNFNNNETDLTKVKSMMDTRIEEVKALATAAGVTEVELHSLNYNVNSNGGGDGCGMSQGSKTFQVYGNLNFKVTPTDQASALMVALVEKGYNANFNVNMNRQCQ